MRPSMIASALLLAFGVWGATATSSGLEFNDAEFRDDAPQVATQTASQAPITTMPAGDAVRGKAVWESSCRGCHALDANKIGPAHRGVVGRIAGTAPNFSYSAGVKASGLTWTRETLDTWLFDPQALIKGARMSYKLKNAQSRADVIAYLAAEGGKTEAGTAQKAP
jgi:cytochrome c